jgi:Cytochrome C'
MSVEQVRHLPILLTVLLPAVSLAQAPVPEDTRTVVDMPALQQALIRQDMLDHLIALEAILGDLSSNQLNAAADIAEGRLGLSSTGKHAARTAGQGPGRFMPEAMRSIGIGMHKSASEFAKVARTGDRDAAYKALQPVVGACVACHAGFRLR